MSIDVSITGSLGFYTFSMNNARAGAWVKSNVLIPKYNGGGANFHCDSTADTEAIALGMIKYGLTVELNGRQVYIGTLD